MNSIAWFTHNMFSFHFFFESYSRKNKNKTLKYMNPAVQ